MKQLFPRGKRIRPTDKDLVFHAALAALFPVFLLVVLLFHIRQIAGTNWQEVSEYYGAAEPPVRCGESHLSGLTEPPHFFIKLLCHCWVQSIYFSHREVFSWVNTFNIDLIGIIRYAIHDGIGKSTFTITDLLVPLTFTELRTKDR